ncbi:tape measure protein [Tetragenococcus halophilus]|uniref:Tape measure protein n=1 Tax=Tetragenococcus halophilus (strain DSM 20338 / JCM 20259 / NCIMB 9735 / NBRC 12172) TaxID=945021 RepID=A0AAN1VRD4_TETHN|nr:tape measure protein [Tetragenococcus halophilus]BAK94201.1 hypothetical protein TEH_08740 [Tetragenococcus halophilus NBRC 12172]GBD70750.1 putative uncharacterized protein [Tetragenococcus halophilus subsp. halophilus]
MADQEMGGVNISISADSSQAERQMAQFFDWFTSAGAEATKLSSSIGGVMNKMSKMGQAGSRSSKNVISSYNDVQRQAQKTRDTASQIGSALKKSADRGIAGYQTLTKGVKSDNAQMSKDTQAKFSKMEGSSKKSFDEMYRDSKTFNSLLKESTKASFGELGQGFRDLGNGFKSVAGNIKNVASSMGGWFKTAAGAIANAFRHPIQTMQSLGGIARDAGSKVSGFISSGFSMAKDLAISQLDKLKGGLSSIAESAKAAGNRAKNFFVTGFNGIVTGAGNILSSVGNTLSNLPDTARQAGANVKDWFVRNIKGIPGESDSIWTRIKNGVMSIPKKARNAGATIKEKLGNVWRSVKNASGKFLPGVKSDMKQNIDKPSQKSKMSVMDMAKAFGLVQIAGKAFNGLKNQMSGAINRMDTMNNSSRAFENMGFTAKETEGAMDGLDKALEGMPTPLDEAVQGVQLLASSTDDVGKSQKVFNSINDAILGFGGSTEEVNSAVMQLSQGFSKGKIQGEEWNSMINSQMGPALNAMADNMNMSTDEMREGLSDGTISIDEFQDQLIKLDEEGGGDLKALRKVAQDATDGIKTSFGNMGISIQRGLVEVVESFNDFVKDVTGSSIADWITRFGKAAEENLSKVGDVLQSITPYIKDFINFLKDNGPVIKPIIAGIGAAFATWVTIKTATAAISGLISAVTFLASPMGIFLTLVAAAVAAGVALYQNWDTISKYAGKVADFISNAWGSAVDWIKEKWSGFTEFFSGLWTAVAEATVAGWEWIKAAPGNAYEWLKEKWNGIVEFFVGLWTSVTETTAEMWAGIKEFFNGVVLGFKESWNGIVEFFVNLWNSVKETIVVAWQGIIEFFGPIVQSIIQPFMPLIEWFSTLWNQIKNIAAQAWNIIKAVIMAPVLALIDLITGDFGQLKADMQMIWNNIKGSAQSIWNSVKTIIVGYVKALVQTAKNLFNNMKNGISNIWNGIKNLASTVWNGIKNTVVNLVKGTVNTVKNWWNNLKTGTVNLFNNIKDGAVNIWNGLVNSVQNFVKKMVAYIPHQWNNLKNRTKKLFSDLSQGAQNIWNSMIDGIVGFVTGLVSTVEQKWNEIKTGTIDIVTGMVDSVIGFWDDLVESVKDTVDTVKEWFEKIGDIDLLDAGESIMDSLLDGLKKPWNGIKDFVGGIGDWIRDHKGPIEYDRQLLIPAGEAIMEGLNNGLSDGFQSVENTVGGLAERIKSVMQDAAQNISMSSDTNAALTAEFKGQDKEEQRSKNTLPDMEADDSANGAGFLQTFLAGFRSAIPQAQEVILNFMQLWNGMLTQNAPVQAQIGTTWLQMFLQGFNMVLPIVVEQLRTFINLANVLLKNNYNPMLMHGRTWWQQFLNGFNGVYPVIVNRIRKFVQTTNRTLSNNNGKMTNHGRTWLQNMLNGFNNIYPRFMSREDAFVRDTNNNLSGNDRNMTNHGRTWWQNMLNGFNNIYPNFISRVKTFIREINRLLSNNDNPMQRQGRTWLQRLLNGFNSLYSSFTRRVDQLGNDSVNNLRSKNGDFYDAGKYLMQRLKDGIESMQSALENTMNGIANKMTGGIGKGVNGVISGVNHVMEEVESDKKLDTWDVPSYAKGTGGHPEDGPAIVNDQKGSKYKEVFQNPGEAPMMANARNAMVYLKKGAKVWNANLSEKMLKAKNKLQSNPLPHYKKGTEKEEDIDIFDIIDSEKAFGKFINNKVDYGSIQEPWKNMTKSATKAMIEQAYSFVEKEAEEFMGGSFDGDIWNKGPSEANGVYSYLVKIAKRVTDKFPGMSITSGYRPGDRYYHGKRQAIDLAYPASDNGSSKYKEPANWVFKKFKDQVAYVIALNKIKDRTGMGGEGKTMSWANWPSGGHMDHLHLNGMFGPGDVGKGPAGGEDSISGSGVNRWRKTAIKALKMTDQYSKNNLNLLMNQMKKESNGNPKAINKWDSNAQRGDPSKGLMQVIGSTFDSYKMKGHGNIYNPLDNILAAIRYTKANYTSLASGWRGVGYENGGMVTKDGLYRMGEGNKNEMVLPLSNPKRAMELIMQALQYMSNNGSNLINQAVNGIKQMAMNMPSNLSGSFGNIASSFSTGGASDLSSIVNLLEENNRLTEQNTELLAQVRDKDNNTYLNDKKMSKGLGPSMDKVQGQRRKNKERGLNN